MKRLGNIIDENTISVEFCSNCIKNAIVGKTKRNEVISIKENIEEYAYALRQMILKQDGMDFNPAPYRFEERMENGKMRKLCKPEFWPDQCVHHVMIESIKEFLMKRIDTYVCSSIPGRGIDYGLNALERIIQRGKYLDTKFYLKMDIKKCFDSMSSQMIYDRMTLIIKDKRWLELFHKIIMNHPTLPIGLYMSAWILNIILKPLDDFIRSHEVAKYYVRYMDDMVVFGPNKRHLYRLQEEIEIKLKELYGLSMKENWKIALTDVKRKDVFRNGVDMLGFRVYRDKTILRKKNFIKIRNHYFHMQKLKRRHKKITVKECMSFVSKAAHRYRVCNNTLNSKYFFEIEIEKLIDEISIDFRKRFGINLRKCKKLSYFARKILEEGVKNGYIDIKPSKRRLEKKKEEVERISLLRTKNEDFRNCKSVFDVVRYFEAGRFQYSKEFTDFMMKSSKEDKMIINLAEELKEYAMHHPFQMDDGDVGPRYIPNYGPRKQEENKKVNTKEDPTEKYKKEAYRRAIAYSSALVNRERKVLYNMNFSKVINTTKSPSHPFGPEPPSIVIPV